MWMDTIPLNDFLEGKLSSIRLSWEEIKNRSHEISWLLKQNSNWAITQFVWKWYPLSNDYIPDCLVPIAWKHIFDYGLERNGKWATLIRQHIMPALNTFADHFFTRFSKQLFVISGYRSFLEQELIYNSSTNKSYVAKAWESEHQLWLVLDVIHAWPESLKKRTQNIDDGYVQMLEWVIRNAHIYWFHISYQKWINIDWYSPEPRHMRYLWKKISNWLFINNLTYTELITALEENEF